MIIQEETHSKTHIERRNRRADASSVCPTSSILIAVLVLGSMLLAFSCLSINRAGNAGEEGVNPSAPGTITNLTVKGNSGTSFVIQWDVPTRTGTTTNGTALSLDEVQYRIYYLEEEVEGQAKPSAESIRENFYNDSKEIERSSQEDVIEASVGGLKLETRYFIAVASFNSLVLPQLETISGEVVEVTTSNGEDDTSFVPGVVTRLTATENGSTSFVIRWNAPTNTGKKIDGTVLSFGEIGYRVYLLKEEEEGQTKPSAESIRDNSNTVKVEPSSGSTPGNVIALSLSGLETATRYFIAVASFNPFVESQLETISPEVVAETTGTTRIKKDFRGQLSYDETYRVLAGSNHTITPISMPTVLDTDTNTTIEYILIQISGTNFVPPNVPYITSMNGEITIDSMVRTGTARYRVYAEAEGYRTQTVEITISIIRDFVKPDLDGALVYAETEYQFIEGMRDTIRPSFAPTVPGTDTSGARVRYSLERSFGTEFVPEPSIDVDSGIITIDSITNIGRARYMISAEATNYNIWQVELIINVVTKPDLDGALAYAKTEYEFNVGTSDTITPVSRPTVPETDTNTTIEYSLIQISGTNFVPPNIPYINSMNGEITINSITNTGRGRYTVRAEADGYSMREVTLIIIINENINDNMLRVSTYHSEATTVLPVGFGQAIEDNGAFAMADSADVISISSASGFANVNYTIRFGTAPDNYSMSYTKAASGGAVTISKSELKSKFIANSFTSGAVIGISGPGITGTQYVATYRPSHIYNHQDLQAMRKNLAEDYVLKKNVEFSNTSTSNYETVGGRNNSFAGSLDGTGLSITGIQIESPNDSYQGLFGTIEAAAADMVIVQNLVLRNFKITGKAYVGSLAGQIKRGVIDNVSVEVSDADAGKVEVRDAVYVNNVGSGFGGGLVGRAGTGISGISDTQVVIRNTSSAAAVTGVGAESNQIGGLVGEVSLKNVILTGSYATGAVSGTGISVGGLVGYNRVGTVLDSYATGAVRGTGLYVGGLVGYNSGTVLGYATGAVSGNSSVGGLVGEHNNRTKTVVGYAIGDVTGSNDVGGLVGYNRIGTVSGYATGNVTGTLSNIGGLVGFNNGTTFGYVTGSVTGSVLGPVTGPETGSNYVGGLVGYNRVGTVYGYVTGSVSGNERIGGLAGWNDTGTVYGYAIGSVIGSNFVGGLVGFNVSGDFTGYVRNVVRRVGGTSLNFGIIAGYNRGPQSVTELFGSDSESKIYDGETGTIALTGTTGLGARLLTPLDLVKTTFSNSESSAFPFGADLEEWTWVADGKWPAINIGDNIKHAVEQPLDQPRDQ